MVTCPKVIWPPAPSLWPQVVLDAVHRARARHKTIRYIKREASTPKVANAAARSTALYDSSGYALESHHTHFLLVDEAVCAQGGSDSKVAVAEAAVAAAADTRELVREALLAEVSPFFALVGLV